MGTLRSLLDRVRRMAGLASEIERSCPPEWGPVVKKYGLGPRDRLRLREIIQYPGAEEPGEISDLGFHDDTPWPPRTPDLVEALRRDPENAALRDKLYECGYELEGGERVRIERGEEGTAPRTSYLVNTTAERLYDYLWPLFEDRAEKPPSRRAMELMRDIHSLVEPYYPDVRLNQIRGAIGNYLKE